MQTDKTIEREIQDRFFDLITNQKENKTSNAFKVYQKLVFYRYEEIIKSTFVQFIKNISERELENSIYEFLKNPPKTEFVWKIANDYIKFVKKLKPKCIQIIDLLFFKGYTQQEASDELAIPLGTVKTQNRNCISDLRIYLKL